MILSLRMKNFYSIIDETVVDFTVPSNSPKGFLYADTGNKDYDKRGSLINVMIGSNAAGKTNIVKALGALQHLIADSQSDPEDLGIYYFHAHALHAKQPTELGVKFAVDGRIFEYNFQMDTDKILDEEMLEYSKEVERFTAKKVFSRSWDSVKESYDAHFYRKDKIDLLPKDLRKNASVISVAKQLPRYDFAQMIADFWRDGVKNNMTFANWLPKREDRVEYLDKMIDDELLRNRVEKIMRRLDVGYDGFWRRDYDVDGKKVYAYFVNHTYGGDVFSTTWNEESSGTRRLVRILMQIISALGRKDGVVVIDDLDASLHPDLAEAVVEMFMDEDININKTQLIFNTHDHRILTMLDKQQIFLVEKNGAGETEIWRLDEVEGVRADDNYYTKYMAGAYAAKPRVDEYE